MPDLRGWITRTLRALRDRLHRHRHEHMYDPVAVDHYTPGATLMSPSSSLHGTVVLWRCHCRVVMSTRLEGRWTLAQVRGERETAAIVDVAPGHAVIKSEHGTEVLDLK